MFHDDLRIPPPGYRSLPRRRAAEGRRMLMAASGVGGVLLLALVGYFLASGGGSQTVAVIEPPSGPVKVKPANPGGLQVSTQASALLGAAGGSTDASLAPAPETPDPAALAAAAKQEQAGAGPNPLPPAPSPTMSGAAPAAAAPAQPAVAVATVPEVAAAGQAQAAAMSVLPPPPPAAPAQNLAQEYTAPAPVADGRVRVQLAALDSRDAALRDWGRLTRRMPSLFDGRRPIIVEAEVNGRTYWRVRTAGFASRAEAARFCDAVHAQGAACAVTPF